MKRNQSLSCWARFTQTNWTLILLSCDFVCCTHYTYPRSVEPHIKSIIFNVLTLTSLLYAKKFFLIFENLCDFKNLISSLPWRFPSKPAKMKGQIKQNVPVFVEEPKTTLEKSFKSNTRMYRLIDRYNMTQYGPLSQVRFLPRHLFSPYNSIC